ncbi:MAG: C-GCAxxG-C-C family protein [Lachnospiraceae bacterium]
MRKEKIRIASDNYQTKGYTCSQAVFSAYLDDIGIDEKTSFRLMQGLGGGVGGMQDICGAFSAAVLVISYYCCGDVMDASTKQTNFKVIREAASLFKEEYDSIICKEILHGNSPKALQCEEKIISAVKIIETLLDKKGEE